MKQKLQSLKDFLLQRKGSQQVSPAQAQNFFKDLLTWRASPVPESCPSQADDSDPPQVRGIAQLLQRELESCQDVQEVERRCHELEDEFERTQRKQKQLIDRSSHSILQTLYLIKQLILYSQHRLSSLHSLLAENTAVRTRISRFLHALSLLRAKALLRKKIKTLNKLKERLNALRQLDRDISVKQLPDRLQILNKNYEHMPRTIKQKAETSRVRIRLNLSAELLVQTFIKPRGQELFLLESFYVLDNGKAQGWRQALLQFAAGCLHFIAVKEEIVLPTDSKVLCRFSDYSKIMTLLQLKKSQGKEVGKIIKELKQAQTNIQNMKKRVNRVFQKVHSHKACRFSGQLASFQRFVSACFQETSKVQKQIQDAVSKIQLKFSGQMKRPFQEILSAI